MDGNCATAPICHFWQYGPVKLQDEDAWSGALAVTGNSMSVTKGTDVCMFTGFDGNVESLKAEIEENWLDIEPTDQTDNSSFYLSEENIKIALNTLYLGLREYEYNQLNLESIRIYGVDLNKNSKNITPPLNEVDAVWQVAYTVIIRANTIINGLKDSDLAKYWPYRNEALAIRSLVYYNIANLWGTILYTEESEFTNPSIYTREQAINAVKNTLSSLGSLKNEDFHINEETIKALQGEIALCENDKSAAYSYLGLCTVDFSVFINEAEEPTMYKLFGEKIPNYTSDIIGLLKKEANGNTTDLVSEWQSFGTHVWGYWLMLKRTGNALSVSGCKDYELLMPIPSRELDLMPPLSQNPGY